MLIECRTALFVVMVSSRCYTSLLISYLHQSNRCTLIHPASARNCQRSNFRKRPSGRYQRQGILPELFQKLFYLSTEVFYKSIKKRNYGKKNTMFLLSMALVLHCPIQKAILKNTAKCFRFIIPNAEGLRLCVLRYMMSAMISYLTEF